jgi:hypothetical protein
VTVPFQIDYTELLQWHTASPCVLSSDFSVLVLTNTKDATECNRCVLELAWSCLCTPACVSLSSYMAIMQCALDCTVRNCYSSLLPLAFSHTWNAWWTCWWAILCLFSLTTDLTCEVLSCHLYYSLPIGSDAHRLPSAQRSLLLARTGSINWLAPTPSLLSCWLVFWPSRPHPNI